MQEEFFKVLKEKKTGKLREFLKKNKTIDLAKTLDSDGNTGFIIACQLNAYLLLTMLIKHVRRGIKNEAQKPIKIEPAQQYHHPDPQPPEYIRVCGYTLCM